MHGAAQHSIVLVILSGRYARNPSGGRQEARILHPQRSEHILCGIFIQAHAGNFLYQESESFEVDIAIEKARAGREDWLLVHSHLISRIAALPSRLEVKVLRQPGIMREQLTNRNVALPVPGELGQVVIHRLVNADLPFLH